jgi:hypothetical protein
VRPLSRERITLWACRFRSMASAWLLLLGHMVLLQLDKMLGRIPVLFLPDPTNPPKKRKNTSISYICIFR